MAKELRGKNKQLKGMEVKGGNYKYIDKKKNDLTNNVVADPKEMEKGIEEIMDVSNQNIIK